MVEILILWTLGLIVITIAWGGIDKIAVPIKTLAQSLQAPERSKRVEIVGAGLFTFAVLAIMVAAAGNHYMEEWAGLPTLLIWAGGLWLIPFRFDAVGHYWLSSLTIVGVLVLFWVGSTSYHSARAHAQTNVSTHQGPDTSTTLTGLGFLFWTVLIGLTVAAIARYTSTWNAAALNS